jgi:hypothetical protein
MRHFRFAQGTAGNAGAQNPPVKAVGAHYDFAHYALRGHFLSDPPGMMRRLASDDGRHFLDAILAEVDDADAGEMDPEEFAVHRCAIECSSCIIIEMPPPSGPAEAYMVALVIGILSMPKAHFYDNPRFTHYFTLERPVEVHAEGDPSVFCAWDAETHYNFGAGPPPTVEAFLWRLHAFSAGPRTNCGGE